MNPPNTFIRMAVALLMLAGLLATADKAYSQRMASRPGWILEVPTGPDFKYYQAIGTSTQSLEDARKRAFTNVVSGIAAEKRVQIQVNTSSSTSQTNKGKTFQINDTFFEVVEMSTGTSVLSGLSFEEEYSERTRLANGTVQYDFWILMRLPKSANSRYVQKSYGFAPVWRSALVPGWGQLYKKNQNAKGIALLAATGLIVTGVIVAENQRSSNVTNALNTRDIYERRAFVETADRWENTRNAIAIVGGAVYLYNLVDAITAKGAKRYALHPTKNLKITPYYAFQQAGIQATFTIR